MKGALIIISVLLLCSFILLCTPRHVAVADSVIPYPEALEDASIYVNDISDKIDGSLIIGNGDINALIYQHNDSLILSITKNDVWDARVLTENDPPLPTLELIKELGKSETALPIFSNQGYILPEGETWEAEDSYHTGAFPCPRQCARIMILPRSSLKNKAAGELNLLHAEAKISDASTKKSIAQFRALADRNAFSIFTTASVQLQPILSEGLPESETGKTNNVAWLKQTIPGDLDWPGMEFAVAVASQADRHVVAVVTSFESVDVVMEAVKQAASTLKADETNLVKVHESEWRQFWSKSGVQIGNKLLQQNWYRSLYFLRCVSAPGVQSVGLFAGLVNDTPAWHGDYHTNYNIQQTYWTALAANHPELCEPYDRLISEYLPRAQWLAEKVYSLNGAYYPHVLFAYEPPDPEACFSRRGRQYIHHVWGMTLGVNGFSVQPVWQRYKYDPDPQRLQKVVYPVMRETALFYANFIEQCDGDSIAKLGPTVSPEHWGWSKYLDRNYDCTFDIALIRYTLEAAIEAAKILDQDIQLVEKFRAALLRLPDYPRDKKGAIIVDVARAPAIEYNIPVPATPVFPGDVVTWWSDNDEKEIFARTIDGLKWNGNNATFMLAIARARLSMDGTEEWLGREINTRQRSNGTLSLNRLQPHHRFNDFGHYTEQFGVGMAVSELLLQSVNDIIRIFPVLSSNEPVSFANLRAQGGFLVSAQGSKQSVEQLHIKSLYGGTLRLVSPWHTIEAKVDDSQPFQIIKQDAHGVIEISTAANDAWTFRSGDN